MKKMTKREMNLENIGNNLKWKWRQNNYNQNMKYEICIRWNYN